MIRQLVKPRRRQVLIDVSTQRDYFLAQGSACIRNHRHVLANVRRMMAWARRKDIPVVSTCEVYPNNNGHSDPGYCIDGTWGQRKISYSMLSRRASFPANSANELPGDILRRFQQVILHNRCSDPFEEPRIDRLLTEVLASEFIVIGACAEGAVEAVVLGLLQRGKRVAVVCDAVGSHDKREGKMAFRKMRAKAQSSSRPAISPANRTLKSSACATVSSASRRPKRCPSMWAKTPLNPTNAQYSTACPPAY